MNVIDRSLADSEYTQLCVSCAFHFGIPLHKELFSFKYMGYIAAYN